MKIALLGGAFDPPHCGHELTISRLLNFGQIDEVWLVPSGSRPDKRYNSSPEEREAMVSLLKDSVTDSRVKIFFDQIREKLPGSYTVDLLRHLRELQPKDEFYLVIGSDIAGDIVKWREGNALLRDARFIIIERPGGAAPDLRAFSSARILSDPYGLHSSVSSTAARELAKRKICLSGIVPECIASYIKIRKLYEE